MNTIKGVPEMLTPAEFATLAKIPVKRVRAMIRIGAIPVKRFGQRLVRITPENAIKVMNSNR
jgi:hypothetical protein